MSVRLISSRSLRNNLLEGPIAEELGNAANLEYIDLSSNQLSGSLPSGLNFGANLTAFNVTANFLNGTVPESFSRLIGSINGNCFSNVLNATAYNKQELLASIATTTTTTTTTVALTVSDSTAPPTTSASVTQSFTPSSSTFASSSLATTATNSNETSSFPVAAVAGGVGGAVCLMAAILVAVLILRRRSQSARKDIPAQASQPAPQASSLLQQSGVLPPFQTQYQATSTSYFQSSTPPLPAKDDETLENAEKGGMGLLFSNPNNIPNVGSHVPPVTYSGAEWQKQGYSATAGGIGSSAQYQSAEADKKYQYDGPLAQKGSGSSSGPRPASAAEGCVDVKARCWWDPAEEPDNDDASADHGIDGAQLLVLTDARLQQIGVTQPVARDIILGAAAEFRSGMAANASAGRF
ncbi:hypothetical protein HDU96_009322 [Phlyctochytrium bullatum]|nr:hypothetical protein HDU96_009322 [Phlyctochytrium bullatum]